MANLPNDTDVDLVCVSSILFETILGESLCSKFSIKHVQDLDQLLKNSKKKAKCRKDKAKTFINNESVHTQIIPFKDLKVSTKTIMVYPNIQIEYRRFIR